MPSGYLYFVSPAYLYFCFPAFFTHGNAASWVESMKNCEPGYLFGNVDLRVPSQYCNLSTDNIDVHWIGVARQM